MSDLLSYDAAVIWVEDNELHGTYHRSCSLGFSSLKYWLFTNCRFKSGVGDVTKRRLNFLDHCFECHWSNDCCYCGHGPYQCVCDVDDFGIVPGHHGVCVEQRGDEFPI